MFAAEKDGTLLSYVDYYKLNVIKVRDPYNFPKADECIDSVEDAQIFSPPDTNSGYWQIEVDKADREKVVLTLHQGLKQFKMMRSV